MCGIAGVISQKENISEVLLSRMTEVIAHRGPDGEGRWINTRRNAGLGHRRLAIIDLTETGKQPMQFADGRYTITYNGEIYNYIELREQLEARGTKFISTSDTEVLLALYAEMKEKCLGMLDGMFAFAIWDEFEERLFIARDRFGEKPFYFSVHEDSFYFASEMKALWAAGVPRVVNQEMLFNYLQSGRMFNPSDLSETFYENIFKLKAAHFSYVSPRNLAVKQTRYWDIEIQKIDERISEAEAKEKFRGLVTQSVKRRLRSDVPVGSSLSGGLDSSLIVCTIDQLNHAKQIRQATFSARFPGFEKDEGDFMQAVIDQTNVEPHFVYPDEKGLIENFEKLCLHQEEPFGSASIYAQFCVMQLAKENNVTVLLDGQGADELLAGYHPFFNDYFHELKSRDRESWHRELRAHRNLYSDLNGGLGLKERVKRALPQHLKQSARHFVRAFKGNTLSFLENDFLKTNRRRDFVSPTDPATLQESLYRHACGGSLEELLRYADRNSMAHSREVRLPFLNHELAEFVFSLPAHFKIRNGITKYILRESFRGLLPEKISERKDKIGYEPPQKSWLQNQRLLEMVGHSAEILADRKILKKNALSFIQSREKETTIYNSYNWKILMAANLFKP